MANTYDDQAGRRVSIDILIIRINAKDVLKVSITQMLLKNQLSPCLPCSPSGIAD